MDESKFLNNKNRNNNEDKKRIYKHLNKILITILLTIIVLIVSKMNPNMKKIIKEKLFEENFSFSSVRKFSEEYLGGILPFDKIEPNDKSVFNEKLIYEEINDYKDGAVLKVNSNYLIPVLESGIIVFIGEKDKYGKTVIVQQVNGIDLWYSNINIGEHKLYDYIEKGDLIGEAIENKIYLTYQKSGEFLNYKEYLK